MSGLEISFGAVLLLFSIVIVVIILFQEGQQQDLDTIIGGADTLLSKNKARSIGASLSRWAKAIAVGLLVMAIAINAATFSAGK